MGGLWHQSIKVSAKMTPCHSWRALRLTSASSSWGAEGSSPHRVGLPTFSLLTDSAAGARETSNLTSQPPLHIFSHSSSFSPNPDPNPNLLVLFPSSFVCLVLIPLSCSGELKEELFMKPPEWERAYASVGVLALFHTLPLHSLLASVSFLFSAQQQTEIICEEYKKGVRWF